MAKKSALHEAIKSQDVAAISQILNSGKAKLEDEVETSARYLMRPIHFAVQYGHSESALDIDWLAQEGADVNAKSRDASRPDPYKEHVTALYYAAETNNISAAFALLNRSADPDIACRGWTPLHCAAELDHLVMVNLLVDNGAKIMALNPDNRMTPLHSAGFNGATKACCMLWLLGADLNANDAEGRTPLDLAIANQSLSTAAILRRLATPSSTSAMSLVRSAERLLAEVKGSKSILRIEPLVNELERLKAIDFPLTRDGLTVLHWVALVNWPEGVELVLNRGANPDALDKDNWTALMCAAAGNNENRTHDDAALLRCIQLLTSSGNNVDSVDSDGQTAAMLAAKTRRSDAAIYLLRQGSNPNSVDRQGKSFLTLAAEAGQANLVEELLTAGADPDFLDAQGRKPEQLPNLNPKVSAVFLAWRERSELSGIPLPRNENVDDTQTDSGRL